MPALTAARAVAPAFDPSVLAPPMVALADVRVAFGSLTAVDGVTLSVPEGETLCLVGPSGSGKSTLLRVIAGLERPDRGGVTIEGIDGEAGPLFVAPERRRIGVVFQDYALFPHLTVAENVAFGLTGRPRAEVRQIVASLLERVGVARYADSYPHTMSGGERQRVALARALAPSPRVLLMDEPFSSLDGRLRDQVRATTMSVLHDTGTTAIVVTHDPAEALRLGSRVALMRQGRIVQCDTPSALYLHPASLFAARFFGDATELPIVRSAQALETPFGRVAPTGGVEDVCVCVRPADVQVGPGTGAHPARVISTTFREGWHDVVIDVAWQGPTVRLMLQLRGGRAPSPGEIIPVHVDPARLLVTRADASSTRTH
jgi:iron(III) transport system ATP-binding protein